MGLGAKENSGSFVNFLDDLSDAFFTKAINVFPFGTYCRIRSLVFC